MKENVCRGNGVVILGGEARVQSTGWRVLPPTAGTKEGSGGPCKVSLIPVPAARALDFLVSEPRSRLGQPVGFLPGSLLLEAAGDLDPLLDFCVCGVVF